MSLNIFNINLQKINFSFKKKKKVEKVATFNNDIIIEILPENLDYVLDLKTMTILTLTYPNYLIKNYYNHNLKMDECKSYIGKLLVSVEHLKDFTFFFDKILNKMIKHNQHNLKKNVKINGNNCCFNIFALYDNDGTYAFIISNTIYTKQRIIL